MFRDFEVGSGEPPQTGNELVFHYTGYNESASSIDSSYRKGQPAQTRLGVGGMIPGKWGHDGSPCLPCTYYYLINLYLLHRTDLFGLLLLMEPSCLNLLVNN